MASAVILISTLFFCLLLVNAAPKQGDKSDENDYLAPFISEMKNSQGMCFDYFKSSLKKVLLQALGQLKDGDEETPNSQIRCFVMCLLKKAGIAQGDDAKFGVEPILAKMKNGSDDKKEAIISAAESCKSEAAKGETSCDKGYIFINCVFRSLTGVATGGGADAADDENSTSEDSSDEIVA